MGAFNPIIHRGFRCRRPDLDAHQMPPCRLAQSLEEVVSVGINARKDSAAWRTYVANTMRDSKGKYPTCGFRNQVGSIVQWNWSHIPLWVISGHLGLHEKASALLLKADILRGGALCAISRHLLSVTRRTRESRIGSQLVMRDFSALSLFRIEMSGDDDCSSLRDE